MNNNKKQTIGYIAVTISLTLILLMAGVMGCMFIGGRSVGRDIASNIGVSVFVKDNITEDQTKSLKQMMGKQSMIESWNYVSKQAAAKDFEQAMGVNFTETLQNNPLPASYDLKLAGDSLELAQVQKLVAGLSSMAGVDQVSYGEKVVEKVAETFSWIVQLMWILCGVMLVVAMILIYNTVGLAVGNNRQAIQTMKLVGATPAFIRKPYLSRAVISGAFAGLFSGIMLMALVRFVRDAIPIINIKFQTIELMTIISAQVLSGILICLIFTIFSVNKLIRKR